MAVVAIAQQSLEIDSLHRCAATLNFTVNMSIRSEKIVTSPDCFWCSEPLIEVNSANPARGTEAYNRMRTRDHLIPWKKGGTFTVPSCRACNELKADMDPGEFREKFRPHVAEELFDYVINIARAKQLDPLTAMRRSWRQRKYKKRRAIKVQKDASYYEGVYVAGYSTQNPAQRTP